jgi:hypothetical protein
MKITYDAFDKIGVAETFIINALILRDSDKDYMGDLDYTVLEGDVSLLSDEQIKDMEMSCTLEYVERMRDYYND